MLARPAFFKLLLVPALFPVALNANVLSDGHVSVSHNTNVGNSVNSDGAISDTLMSADFGLGRLFVPRPGRSFVISANAGLQQYARYDGLNHARLGAALDYQHRLGLGAYATGVGFSVSADYLAHRRSVRDGWLYRAALQTNRRFTPALRLQGDLSYAVRDADSNKARLWGMAPGPDVFSQENTALGVELEYTLSDTALLIIDYRLGRGDIEGTSRPDAMMVQNYRAAAWDPAYGEDYISYRTRGSSHSMGVEWNQAIGRDSSLGIWFQRHIGRVGGGHSYHSNVLGTGLTTRF
jgi:hypothetical protein